MIRMHENKLKKQQQINKIAYRTIHNIQRVWRSKLKVKKKNSMEVSRVHGYVCMQICVG